MTEIPCATDRQSLIDAAWAAANLLASAMDSNSRLSITGFTSEMTMGLLSEQRASRLMDFWVWWRSLWDHYGDVLDRIENGEAASFDPAVPGPCPWSIWQLAEQPPTEQMP